MSAIREVLRLLLPALSEVLEEQPEVARRIATALGIVAAPAPEPSKLMTVQQYAEHASVSRRTICEWQRQGLPVRKRGRYVRVPVPEADAWLSAVKRGDDHELVDEARRAAGRALGSVHNMGCANTTDHPSSSRKTSNSQNGLTSPQEGGE